jgi:DNA-binding NarL/FixJ family response regulator
VHRLFVTVHSDDPGLREELLSGLPADRAVTDLSDGEVSGHLQTEAPDLVFVDAGPPAPSSLPMGLREAYPSAFVVLVTGEVDEAALELGAALGADAYLRRDEQPADGATALLALAMITRPSRAHMRPSRRLSRPPKTCTPRRNG